MSVFIRLSYSLCMVLLCLCFLGDALVLDSQILISNQTFGFVSQTIGLFAVGRNRPPSLVAFAQPDR